VEAFSYYQLEPLFNLTQDEPFSMHPTARSSRSVDLLAVCYVPHDALVSACLEMLRGVILQQLERQEKDSCVVDLYQPACFSHPIVGLFSRDAEKAKEERKQYHREYLLPVHRPTFLSSCSLRGAEDTTLTRLVNVHRGLVAPLKGGRQYLVQGEYEYYHYLQDHLNDNGWGCAYRSLQTICSWLRRQGYTHKPDPTHKEIQQILVSMGDKPPTFLGSSQWIGAFEISLCLDERYGVESRIINCQSGSDISSHAAQLKNHFLTQGSPIMIGGGVLAYTLLGIDWNQDTGDVRYLILDPHYTGKESKTTIQQAGWCNWKEPSLFRTDAFYNLCLPQCPSIDR